MISKKPTPKQLIADIRSLAKSHPNKNISQGFYRKHGKYGACDQYQSAFGTFPDFKRAAGMHTTRQVQKVKNRIGKTLASNEIKDFHKTEIYPYANKFRKKRNKRFKEALIISDTHDTKMDRFLFDVAVDVAKRRQPDHMIWNGDIFGNDPFSRWPKDPRSMNVAGGFQFVRNEIFAPMKKAVPDAEQDFVIGNHDLWLLKHLADRSPEIRMLLSDVLGLSLSDIFGLNEFEINLVSKFDLEEWKIENSKIKQNYKVYDGCFTAAHKQDWSLGTSGTSGHTHRPRLECSTSIPMGAMQWMTTGCMSHTDEIYIDGLPTAQQGFGYAVWDTKTKSVQVEPLNLTGNHITIDGYRYERPE